VADAGASESRKRSAPHVRARARACQAAHGALQRPVRPHALPWCCRRDWSQEVLMVSHRLARLVGISLLLAAALVLPPVATRAAPLLQDTPETVGRAAIATARANSSQVAIALDAPRPGATVQGFAFIHGWIADLLPDGAGIDEQNIQVWLERPERRPL